jgi:hypothetical protein
MRSPLLARVLVVFVVLMIILSLVISSIPGPIFWEVVLVPMPL